MNNGKENGRNSSEKKPLTRHPLCRRPRSISRLVQFLTNYFSNTYRSNPLSTSPVPRFCGRWKASSTGTDFGNTATFSTHSKQYFCHGPTKCGKGWTTRQRVFPYFLTLSVHFVNFKILLFVDNCPRWSFCLAMRLWQILQVNTPFPHWCSKSELLYPMPCNSFGILHIF